MTTGKKKIYVTHPLRGDGISDVQQISENQRKVDAICKQITSEHPDVLVLSPIHAFSFISALGPQERVLVYCLMLLEVADEVWVFGDYQTSEGCCLEIEHARSLGKTVVFAAERELEAKEYADF